MKILFSILIVILLVVTFTTVIWNTYLPISSNRSAEFIDYADYLLKKEYSQNDFIQQHVHIPLVESFSGDTEKIDVIDESLHTVNVGQRQISADDRVHNVLLTFYVQYGNQEHLIPLLDLLNKYHLQKAIFFIEKRYMDDHEFIIKRIQNQGYQVKLWENLDGYDLHYPPTVYKKIPLIASEILTRVSKDRDAMHLFQVALHYNEFSIVAFSPNIMPHKIILEDMLKENGNSLLFVDNGTAKTPDLDISIQHDSIWDLIFPEVNDLKIRYGTWTMALLNKESPNSVVYDESLNAYVVTRPIIMGTQSKLILENTNVLLQTLDGKNNTNFIEIRGEGLIKNSTVTSFDPAIKASNTDPYGPRPYIIVRGGHLNIFNSTISNLGYSIGGLNDTRYAHAALEYYDSKDFIIANSTLSFNYYGFYSEDSSNFKIQNNNVFGNTGYGLDPHTRSKDFLIDSNYVHDNGNQGIICSLSCSNVIISGNTVEYNTEGIGLHWLTNSSMIKDNIVRYNEKYGIFIQKDSFNNIIENNTVVGNRIGIGILDGSGDNIIRNNVVKGNVADSIRIDANNTTNLEIDNEID